RVRRRRPRRRRRLGLGEPDRPVPALVLSPGRSRSAGAALPRQARRPVAAWRTLVDGPASPRDGGRSAGHPPREPSAHVALRDAPAALPGALERAAEPHRDLLRPVE